MNQGMSVLDRSRIGLTERRTEAALGVLLPLLVARPSLVTVAGAALSMLGLPTALGALMVYALLAAAVAVALPSVLRRANRAVWLVAWLALCFFLVSALLGQHSFSFYGEIGADLVAGLGWMLVASSVRDYSRCREGLFAAGLVILAAVSIQLLRMSSGVVDVGYSQYIAYSALPAVLIFFDASLKRMPVLNGVLATLSGLLMLSAGARGPLVVAALFIVARILLQVRSSPRAAVAIAGAGMLLTSLALRFYVEALVALQSILEGIGLSARVVTRMLEGTLMQDRARSALIEHTFDLIAHHPFTGVGMGNERPILAERMGAAADSEALGWYPHNIALEFWAQFGVILGTLLTLLLLVSVVRALVKSADFDRSSVVLIFVGFGLLPLLFSSSYLSWPPFFALVGLCLSFQPGTPSHPGEEGRIVKTFNTMNLGEFAPLTPAVSQTNDACNPAQPRPSRLDPSDHRSHRNHGRIGTSRGSDRSGR